MVRTFEQLADTFVLGIWPFYAGGIAAVYTLRRKRPDLPRPYKVLGYPVTPAIFLLAAAFLLGNAVLDDFRNVLSYLKTGTASSGTGGTLLVFAIILAGIPVYWLWLKLRGGSESASVESKGL
jgi:APA family basic amino acid/polyamine antiporter